LIDITILTDRDSEPQFDKNNKHQNSYIEDLLLKNALTKQGLLTNRVAWDDPNYDWYSTKSVIFRSTWDYFYRFSEFSQWLTDVSTKTKLINSKETIYWNLDKHYLLDLKSKGVHIPESHFIEKGSNTSLQELHENLDWQETVLKPFVSGTARHTYKLNWDNILEHEAIFKKLIADEALMLQPFQHDIVKKGEISLIFFGKQYSHAVLKVVKENDFRVQGNFGGKAYQYKPTIKEIAFAEHVIQCCDEIPSYARVDIFKDNNKQIALSELELIEPELWYRLYPKAADTHAKHLLNTIKNI